MEHDDSIPQEADLHANSLGFISLCNCQSGPLNGSQLKVQWEACTNASSSQEVHSTDMQACSIEAWLNRGGSAGRELMASFPTKGSKKQLAIGNLGAALSRREGHQVAVRRVEVSRQGSARL